MLFIFIKFVGDGDFVSYPRYFENTGTKYSATFVERPREQTGNPFGFNPMASKPHNDMHGVKGGFKEGAGGYDNFVRISVFVDTDGMFVDFV